MVARAALILLATYAIEATDLLLSLITVSLVVEKSSYKDVWQAEHQELAVAERVPSERGL